MKYVHLDEDLDNLSINEYNGSLGSGDNLRIRKPKSFLILKYTLVTYIILHLLFLILSLPSGIESLRKINHEHTEDIHVLWIISIIYCFIFSFVGLLGIFRESFTICVIFCVSMVINLLLLVYSASLHKNKTTPMVLFLLTNWFFTTITIAFTRLIQRSKFNSDDQEFAGDNIVLGSNGHLPKIYVR